MFKTNNTIFIEYSKYPRKTLIPKYVHYNLLPFTVNLSNLLKYLIQVIFLSTSNLNII